MDYRSILKATRRWHRDVVHIILDSFQRTLRVTFPTALDPNRIIEAAEEFHSACRNHTTIRSYRDEAISALPPEHRETDEYEAGNRPFRMIAAEWPHYVLPPGNPLTFLDPGCPCSFFSV